MEAYTVEDNEAFLATLKTIDADDLIDTDAKLNEVIESEQAEDESPLVEDEAPALEPDNLPSAPDFGDEDDA
jgi:hypothetical protein